MAWCTALASTSGTRRQCTFGSSGSCFHNEQREPSVYVSGGGGGKSLLSISEVGLNEVFHTVDFFLDSIDAARFLYPPPAV